MGTFLSFISGIVFSVGLVVSGMTNPEKVIGFLDVFGKWDYSLAFVMAGAVIFNFFSFKYVSKFSKPLCGIQHFLPTKTSIDWKLISGAALFGMGWGLTGICPGPGIVNLVTLRPGAFIFVGSMLVGMVLFKQIEKIWSQS